MARHVPEATRRPIAALFLALALLVPALAAAFATACGRSEPPAVERAEAAPVAVTTRTAEYRRVSEPVRATASVEPSRRVMPGTKILGRVDAVPVSEGQAVKAGQLLAAIESRDLEAAVRQAQAGVDAAQAQLENARAQHERMVALQARGSATTKNLEDATAGFRMAEAGVEQAQANLAAARVTLGYARVVSPIDGWLVAKQIEVGDMVSPGRPLFTVEDLDPVKVVAEVPEAEVTGLAPGDPATVEVTAAGFRQTGSIARIMPAGDAHSRTFRCEIDLPNPEGRLKSGMFARVAFERSAAASVREALLVPAGALVQRGQLEGVYVVEDGHARLRWIRTGARQEGEVEVLSGLAPGDHYVVEPPAGLADGAPVEERAASEGPRGAAGGRS